MTGRLRTLLPVTAALAVAVLAAAAPTLAATPPANDAFAHAAPIGASGVLAGTTAGATTEAGEPGVHAREATAWFRWRPSLPGQAFVLGGTRPVSVHVYTGASLEHLRPDGVPAPDSHGVLAAIDAVPGVTYRLQVVTRTGAAGAFRLTLVQPSRGRPGNATLASATPLTSAMSAAIAGKATVTLSGLTVSAPNNTVWYSWQAPAAPSPSH